MTAEFDSRGGTYDRQTQVAFEKQLYRDQLTRTIVGSLAKPNNYVAGKEAYEDDIVLDRSSFVWVRKFSGGGDEKRITLREAFAGMGVHGDNHTQTGQFPEYMSNAFRINRVKSPGFQIQGEENRRRVQDSIMNIPSDVEEGANNWMGQEDEYDFILSLFNGGDKTVLNSLANGGLAASVGPGSGVGAGLQLAPMHFYTTDTSFATYTPSDLAAWNSTVNDGINGIDAAAADKVTLAQLQKIRAKLDDLHFMPGTLNGQRYKAIALVDPDIAWRIAYILKDDYKYGMERGKNNPIFNVDYQIVHDGVLYVSMPNLKIFRPSYSAANSKITVGPGMASDPREYTNSETVASILYLGAGSVLMGADGKSTIHKAVAQYGEVDGMAVSVHKRRSFVRSQWDTHDGRTESKCFNVLGAFFYEPGIDW